MAFKFKLPNIQFKVTHSKKYKKFSFVTNIKKCVPLLKLILKKKEKRLEAYNDINILLFTKMYEVNIR